MKLNQTIAKHEQLMQELTIRIENMDLEIKALLSELNVTPEQLTSFLSRQENFTPENWNELQKQKERFDAQWDAELSNIPDPRKVQKTQKDRYIPVHWLFVK